MWGKLRNHLEEQIKQDEWLWKRDSIWSVLYSAFRNVINTKLIICFCTTFQRPFPFLAYITCCKRPPFSCVMVKLCRKVGLLKQMSVRNRQSHPGLTGKTPWSLWVSVLLLNTGLSWGSLGDDACWVWLDVWVAELLPETSSTGDKRKAAMCGLFKELWAVRCSDSAGESMFLWQDNPDLKESSDFLMLLLFYKCNIYIYSLSSNHHHHKLSTKSMDLLKALKYSLDCFSVIFF